MDYTEIYKYLEPLCKKAGAIALKHRREGLKIERKNDKEEILAVVTAADTEIDALLKEALTKKYPNFGWLSEETEDNSDRLNKEYVWIVDPIDGTKSYIDGTDYFAISVGLAKNGKPVLGMIYNPAKNELIGGYTGSGVLLNGKKVWVNYAKSMEKATILVSCNELEKGLWKPYEKSVKTKPVHSIAYKLAFAAIGGGDGIVTLKPKSEWDLCAGHAICLEAGFKVGDLKGNELIYNKKNVEAPGLIAIHDCCYAELLNILN